MARDHELQLMTQVAREYYLAGRSRVEIAAELGISRFKVARLIDAARAEGIVTITIRSPGHRDPDVSEQLRRRFGLREAIAVATDTAEAGGVTADGGVTAADELRRQLARAAGEYLAASVTAADVVGFDPGRTVGTIPDHVQHMAACELVQLTGLAGSVQLNGVEILRRLAEVTGGVTHPLFVPMIATDADAASTYRQQPEIAQTLAQYPRLTTAVVSVGSWDPPVSQVYDRLTAAERAKLRAAGVAAETCALMFDGAGRPLPGIADRRVGITLEQLRAVPTVIVVAGGTDKATAIGSLLQAGLIDVLITDAGTAQLVLDASNTNG